MIEIIGAIVAAISAFIGILKEKEKKNKKYSYYVCICIIIAIISYLLNLGWIRILFAPLPAIILIISYWFINRYSIKLIDKTNSLNLFVLFGGLTLLLSNFLLPDFSDVEEYVFFMQITDKNIIGICYKIFPYILVYHVLLLFSQLIYARIIKRKLSHSEENALSKCEKEQPTIK